MCAHVREEGGVKFSIKAKLTHQRIRLKRWFFRLFRLSVRKESVLGFQVHFFKYPVFTSLYRQMFITREYYFESRSETPFIIDCGSNIGMSVLFFKWLYPKSTIIAFEPEPGTFALLKKNVEGNNLANVELHNAAVSDSEGSVDFFSAPHDPGTLTMSMHSTARSGTQASKVFTTRLSPFISRPVDCVKMDIEGAENRVIEDLAKEGKLRYIREMVMEYHHHMEPTDRLAAMLGILEENGFGYQIHSLVKMPFRKNEYQDVMIYAYQKDQAGLS